MNELLDLYAKYKREKKEPKQISSMIETEGGSVLEYRQISRLINTPFKNLRIFPILYEFRVQYGNRQGHWYVRTSADNGSYDWAWMDADGYETLPVVKGHACVVRDVQSVGWLVDLIVVFGLISLGLLVGIAVFLEII